MTEEAAAPAAVERAWEYVQVEVDHRNLADRVGYDVEALAASSR